MPVLVRTERGAGQRVRAAEVRVRAERMMAAMALDASAELSVLLCDDAAIRDLNRRFRGKDRPTDVLAFPMQEPDAGPSPTTHLLGDVVISVDTAARQARGARRSLVDEVTTLLAHGLLHLLGFDHRTRPEERRMAARTDMLRAAARSRRVSGTPGKRRRAKHK